MGAQLIGSFGYQHRSSTHPVPPSIRPARRSKMFMGDVAVGARHMLPAGLWAATCSNKKNKWRPRHKLWACPPLPPAWVLCGLEFQKNVYFGVILRVRGLVLPLADTCPVARDVARDLLFSLARKPKTSTWSRFHRAHHALEDDSEARNVTRATSCIRRITWLISSAPRRYRRGQPCT